MFGDNQSPKPPKKPWKRGFFLKTNVPNSKYEVELHHYRQRKVAKLNENKTLMAQLLSKNTYDSKTYDRDKARTFQTKLKFGLNVKMSKYENEIEKRRQKLIDLLAKEEKQLFLEVIKQSHSADAYAFEEKANKLKKYKEDNEEKRQNLVKHRKNQQLVERLYEYRSIYSEERWKEIHDGQIQQMAEKISRKESERELDRFWYELELKEMEELNKRAAQDAAYILSQKKEIIQYLNEKTKENEILLKQRKQKLLEEFKIEQEKEEQLKLKDLTNEQLRKKINDDHYAALREQIKTNHELKKQKDLEESKLIEIYTKVDEEEFKKEKERQHDKRMETITYYKQYLFDIISQKNKTINQKEGIVRKIVDDYNTTIISEESEDIKQNSHLLRECIEINARLIEEKRKRKEQETKIKNDEKEFANFVQIQNKKLQEHQKRLKILQVEKYRQDLLKQMEYSKILKEREDERNKRLFEQMKEETKNMEATAAELFRKQLGISYQHPFTEKNVCPCPKPNY